MAKDKISQYSTTNALNTDIGGIDIDENCLPSNLNDAIREVMVQLREFQNGDSGDPFITASITATVAAISGGTINGTSVGATTQSTGEFTDLSASASFAVPVLTTATRPSPADKGDLIFNDDSDEFEGYNGTAWSSVGGSAISNDTSTTTDVFPLFADATTGTAANVYTSNAKLLYKPSTGELKSEAQVSTNGIVVNSATIDTDYTISSGNNAMSAGPVLVDATVTVDGVWVIV
jgi:hypothetical protein